jgi:hypothetical protein
VKYEVKVCLADAVDPRFARPRLVIVSIAYVLPFAVRTRTMSWQLVDAPPLVWKRRYVTANPEPSRVRWAVTVAGVRHPEPLAASRDTLNQAAREAGFSRLDPGRTRTASPTPTIAIRLTGHLHATVGWALIPPRADAHPGLPHEQALVSMLNTVDIPMSVENMFM